MDTLQQLRELGLYVLQFQEKGRKNFYHIHVPKDGYTAHNIVEVVEDGMVSIIQSKASLGIGFSSEDNLWYFDRQDYIPGPGRDDFGKGYDTEDEALAAAQEYFTGEPTIVDGWVVPFHRHPELDKSLTRNAIQFARHITAVEAKAIVKEHWSKRLEIFPSGNPYLWLFLDFPNQTNEQLVLYLRRDAQEAFIVSRDQIEE